MTTLLYTHPDCLEHTMGEGHPERPDRLRAVDKLLDDPTFAALERREAPKADWRVIEYKHPARYVSSIFSAVPESGLAYLDADTALSPKSLDAAQRAVGGVCAAIDAVVNGEATNAFCAMRPPGHHAEPKQAMGFCLFNNIAIGAAFARRDLGLERIAVMDFDVHHGNGTQAMFEHNENLFYASTHQSPCYPGTGAVHETGIANNIVNAPLPPGAGSADFRAICSDRVLPALYDFAPDLLLISAGFDAHARDPLADLNLNDDDFRWITEKLIDVANVSAKGRVVSTLEGGYDLRGLMGGVGAHVKALMAA